MKRIDAIRGLMPAVPAEALVVSNIGFPSRELHAVADRPGNFYMLGSMGLASSIGLGLALSQPKPVVVLDGDGSLLMNLGSLVSIAFHKPGNLILVVLDNGTYGSTGDQATMAGKVGVEGICRGCGLEARVLGGDDRLDAALGDALAGRGPNVLVVKVEPGNAKVPIIPLSPVQIKERFMGAARGAI